MNLDEVLNFRHSGWSYEKQKPIGSKRVKHCSIPENADRINTIIKIQSITKIFFITYQFHSYLFIADASVGSILSKRKGSVAVYIGCRMMQQNSHQKRTEKLYLFLHYRKNKRKQPL